ncbi:hypothetical protein HaLaN_30183 [Haematococcus lacustris]|uniref:Uncharacterized protein n=1 Tax=Haematococcus lacustris TaxID=44745 RepID=A0A6A0AEV9_HAELA|nr:hypothetical protein HaLaN_30183 [Haematococcus lacustris]
MQWMPCFMCCPGLVAGPYPQNRLGPPEGQPAAAQAPGGSIRGGLGHRDQAAVEQSSSSHESGALSDVFPRLPSEQPTYRQLSSLMTTQGQVPRQRGLWGGGWCPGRQEGRARARATAPTTAFPGGAGPHPPPKLGSAEFQGQQAGCRQGYAPNTSSRSI